MTTSDLKEQQTLDAARVRLIETIRAYGVEKYNLWIMELIGSGWFSPQEVRAMRDEFVRFEGPEEVKALLKARNSQIEGKLLERLSRYRVEQRFESAREVATKALDEESLIGEMLFGGSTNEETVRTRRSLLATSVAIIAATRGGLLPQRIPALEVALTPDNQSALVWLASGVLIYFFVGFLVRISLDRRLLIRHREIVRDFLAHLINPDTWPRLPRPGPGKKFHSGHVFEYIMRTHPRLFALFLIRGVLDGWFPLAMGLWALWSLWTFATPVHL